MGTGTTAPSTTHYMTIKKLNATIERVRPLSPSAREFTLALSDDLEFLPGAFVNVFADIEGVRVRRAYSLSSVPDDPRRASISVRHSNNGVMSGFLWKDDIVGTTLEIQGPLGLNTVDKITKDKVFLFAFGIGVSVIKPLAEYLARDPKRTLVIALSHRSEDELLYGDTFTELTERFPNVSVRTVFSRPTDDETMRTGYLYDHLDGYDFNNASVYICGQEAACKAMVETIMAERPVGCECFVEGFH